MAFPAKALEQLSYVSVRTPGWSGQLLMFASVIFFISLAFYLGVTYGYVPYLNGRLEEVNDEIQTFSQKIPLSEQQKIIAFYSQISNIKTLLGNHVIVSPLFPWLEEHTMRTVAYTKFSLRSKDKEIRLSGYARSAEEAVEQVQVFEMQPEVKAVHLSNLILASTGFWQFDVRIEFADRFLGQTVSPSIAPQPSLPPPSNESN